MAEGKDAKALMALGKAVAEEMSSGTLGDVSRAAYVFVGESPRLALSIVDLAVAEMRKRKSDDNLIAAYMSMLGSALEVMRLDMESGDAKASNVLASLRVKLIGLAQSGDVSPYLFLMISRQFSVAKLDMGDVLKPLVVGLVGEMGMEDEDDGVETADIEEQLANLAHICDDDPFAMASEFMEATGVMPNEHKLVMASAMSGSNTLAARDAAIGWLFDPASEVRVGAAGVLAQAARAGEVTPESARRLVAVRNWLPQAETGALDTAIEASRRSGAVPSARVQAEVTAVHLSGFDGSGAQSSFVVLKVGRKFAIVALLFKFGFGLRDAWVRRGLTKAEAREFMAEASDALEFYPGSMDFIRTALQHFLAVTREGGGMPPFTLVDAVEAMGLDIVNPRGLDLDPLLAQLTQSLTIGDDVDRQAVLDRSGNWITASHPFMGSWYETGQDVSALFKEKRLSSGKKLDLVLTKLLPSRARKWAELLAWSAYAFLDAGRLDDARDLTIVALELAGGRPVSQIPLMWGIAELTVEVFRMERR